MSTRAVHLELVDSSNTETFLYAFERFISRKSCPSLILSDNAQIFKSAATHLSKYRIEWKFIPCRAPHFGGVWERLIGITKQCLKKLLGKNLVSLVELQTMLCKIECQINNRPLTYVTNEINDPIITPSLLLYGRNIETMSNEYIDRDELLDPSMYSQSIISRRALHVKDLIRRYWLIWKNDYLKALRERDRNLIRTNHSLSIGDIVLICDETPRSEWNLGKIVEILTSSDGVIRSVKLKTKFGFTTRPVIKLINLEIHSNELPYSNSNIVDESNNLSERPKREAAIKARKAISCLDY